MSSRPADSRKHNDAPRLFATPPAWLKNYAECVAPRLEYPAEPVWWLLKRAAHEHPDRVACCYYEQRLTYAELFAAARRTAAALARGGVGPGMRVGLLLPNIPEYLIAAYGVWMAGGVVVSLSPLSSPPEVESLIAATDCHTVIALDVLAPLVLQNNRQPERLLLVSLAGRLPGWQRLPYAFARLRRIGLVASLKGVGEWFSEVISADEEAFWPRRPAPNEPAYILPTGGTTDSPKAVVLSHANLMANAWQLVQWTGARMGQDTMLAVVPFFHSYGLSTCATAGVAAAATLVMFHRFKPEAVLRLIERHRPICFPAVPAMLAQLNERLEKQPRDVSSVEYCISGGAPLDPEVGARFAEFTGGQVVEGYGLSEASPVTHTGPLDGGARPGTIGLPLPDTDARIVDAETGARELPPGEVGELIVRGPQVMLGYWNDLELTRETIRDGWLYTGDLGTCDADGFFRIVDRKKDLIIVSGLNVYPADVEHVLRQFPAVRDAAVVGVADANRGQTVKAHVLVDDPDRFDCSALERFAAERLSKHKRPRQFEIHRDDLPRSFLGKVLRRELRERTEAQSSRAAEVSSTDGLPAEALLTESGPSPTLEDSPSPPTGGNLSQSSN